ncbi:MAG: transcriptional regulator [Planctomycetes bacterium]|nr:transcriptional regulator [Planctomycetota bacterium]MCK5473013.1 transcriptional regulator [Planctomycetota bacterium]
MQKINKIIHQSTRLQIMAALTALTTTKQIDFVYLCNILKLTDGNLGSHLAKLENAGYIKIKKTFVSRKPCTFIKATHKGRNAFENHVATLKTIIKSGKTRQKRPKKLTNST